MVLKSLVNNSNVIAVFCRPADTNNKDIIKVKEIAKKYSIPLKQPNKKDLYRYIPYIRDLKPDLIVVCGYKYIIPKEIFTIPKFRTINIHSSYLPAYRGQHVINWAIINGEKETGVTIHHIDEGIDTGDIILQKKIPIFFEDTAKTVHDKIYDEACKLLLNVLDDIASGKTLQSKKQDDANATYFKPRIPEDGCIDWNRNGLEIYNLIRALVEPWPGAYSCIKGNKIILRSAKFENGLPHNNSFGEIIDVSNSTLTINIKDGKLIVDDYQLIDKNGNKVNMDIKAGNKLG
jgi:methionyl-tRNA formyltransferase